MTAIKVIKMQCRKKPAEQAMYYRVEQLLGVLLHYSMFVGKLGGIRYRQFKLVTYTP